ncbi:MAG: oligosaccharide flippase family protein [Parcubacteria group bacterium]|jgi:O-antigen/teichoic acid export membrane protein
MRLADWKTKFFHPGSFAKNSAILFVGTMLVSVLNYAFHLIIGRVVSAEIYGEAEAIISIINIISVPATTLAMVATKYAAACNADGNHVGSYEIFQYLNKKVLRYGLPIFLGMVISTPWVGSFLNIENNIALLLLWIAMLLSFFSAITSGILRGWQKFGDINKASFWGVAVKLVAGIFLVKIGLALNGIVASFVLGAGATYVATIIALRFGHIKKALGGEATCANTVDFGALKRYVIPVFIGNLAIIILANGDMVLAKHNLDALSAGQYGALTVVSKIIFFATGILASVLFSMAAENNHRGQSSRKILLLALGGVLGASLLATTIYFSYPAFILSLLFGHKYQAVASYLGWFAVAVTLFSLANVMFQYLISIHRTRIAYAMLGVAGGMTGMIFFYGETISSILTIVIGAQALAVVLGVGFLWAGPGK